MSEVRNNEMQILIDIIKAFDPEKFIRFFRDKNRSFAPRAEDLFQYDDDNFRNGKKLGEIQFAQGEKMLICAFQASQPLSERSSKKAQYEKGKKILKDNNADSGIFIFHDSNNNFRFSLIYAEYLGVRRRFSYFKRLTFFVSPRLTNKTFLQQIGECDFFSFENIKEAFSVEPVTKQFYGELQYWYFWAMDKIKFPDDYKYSNDPAKDKEIRNATNLIRLITRIIFIRFLTEKGLIPSELFSGEKLGRIVKDFMKGKKASNFYNAILQNLFFGTLNQKMDERKFAQESGFQTNRNEYGVKNLYRYGDKFLFSKDKVLKLFKDIPFLNGGLFDCLDKENGSGKVIYVDGFSRNSAKQSIIPDFLFFQQEEERADLSNYGLGASRPVRGLIEILNSYNFTIDENTPVDQEIALDPELLGKVFENLLASYNPETATTARKATGSYYTPREIVDYMVQESLVVYLANAINNAPQPPLKLRVGEGGVILPSPLAGEGKGEGDNDSRLRQLLSYSEEIPEFSAPERKKIISAIDNIKILDPACGSGAFPMGILHKLVYALQKLDPENKYWHELQYQKALKESEEVFKQDDKNERQERLKEINEAFDEGINYPDYARKLYLIENCIYGVDIQPIAIQISKLRFFISLVLDQKVDRGKENLGIRALPNLETKFVAANTLIGLDRPTQLAFKNPDIEKKEEELKRIRHKYFEAKTRKEKLDYQKKDQQLRKDIADLLNHSGWDSSIAEKIATFDLYDQNASAEFFDPELMFGIKNPSTSAGASSHNIPSPLVGEGSGEGGFDIVIGNPPYVRQEDLKPIKPIIQKQGFEVYNSTSDIYTYFYEKGWQILGGKGHLTFITSNKWMRAKYGEKLRKFFKDKTALKQIIDFGGHKVFESATVDTNILIFQKNADGRHSCESRNPEILSIKSDFLHETDLTDYFNQNAITMNQQDLDEKCFTFGDDAVMQLKKKMEQVGTPLKDWGVKINRGIVTGFNEAFIIDNETKERLCKEDPKSAEILKPILRGRDIQRYSYKWAGLWVIATFPALNLDIDKYPAIKDYLKSFGKRLHQTGEKGCRKKTGNKWFETQDQIAYWQEFEKEKIIYPNMTKFLPFVYDDKNYYTNQKCYILTNQNNDTALNFFVSLLNSNLFSWYIRIIFPELQGGTRELNENIFRYIPIPKIPESAQQPFIILVAQILTAKKKDPNADTSALEQEIDKMVYPLYGLTPEEIAIIERE